MFRSLIPMQDRSVFPANNRLTEMMNWMGGDWDRFWGDEGNWLPAKAVFSPEMDVVETDSQFQVSADLPGMKPEEVNVEMYEGALVISGKREEKKEEEGKTYHRVERHYGEFRRVLPLPRAIDPDAVHAEFDNGTLHVTVPKTEEAKTKKIKID